MKNIAIIAPSGYVKEEDKLCLAKNFLEKMGMNVTIYPSCYKKFRYMAGDDKTRLDDLHRAYLDKQTDTIICARGGYGIIRLLDKIDFEIIKENPKKIIGSSDITALLLSIYKKTGQITYHAKMALNGISSMDEDEFIKYKNTVENNLYKIPDNTINTKGILWGGNLATIVSMFGSNANDYISDDNIILFLEDINEPVYKIDRMLTQIIRNKELSSKIKGVIFGEFIGADEYLNDVLSEFANILNVPFAFDTNITHGINNKVTPVGIKINC